MFSFYDIPCLTILAICGALVYLTRITRDIVARNHNEPPPLSYWIPYLGNAMAFARNYSEIYNLISKRNLGRAGSLTLMGQRVYVFTSAKDVSSVYRDSSLRFEPLVLWGLRVVFGLSKESEKILLDESNGPESGPLFQYSPFFHNALSEGPNTNDFALVFLERLASQFIQFDKRLACQPKGIDSDLLEWARRFIGTASTQALMGDHIFQCEPDLLKYSWQFERDLPTLQAALPYFLARAQYANREKIVNAFMKFHQSSKADKKSTFWWLDATENLAASGGMSPRDVGVLIFGIWIAVSSNTNLTAFWLLLHIISTPGLANAIRTETGEIFANSDVLDTDALVTCPLLRSVHNETLRHYSTAASRRLATEDTIIGNYTVRQGGVIVCPNRLQHMDAQIWGADVDAFIPDRFKRKASENIYRGEEGWLRPFGGGKSLCPGRHYANKSILAFVASCLHRYNFTLVKGESLPAPNLSMSD
ncbi:cytochrome P450, partial [Dendrothele bispora CBS 962.96]